MSLMIDIQKELHAPKGQTNDFGGYQYRNCSDIIQAVKPILQDKALYLHLSDEMVNIGDRYYLKATATVFDENDKVIGQATGYAREALDKKGMDQAQITGAASSYARKYALNGLFAIDDGKDADSMDNSQAEPQAEMEKPWFNEEDFEKMRDKFQAAMKDGTRTGPEIVKNLRNTFKVNKKFAADIEGLADATV